jgi:hypothetical protein
MEEGAAANVGGTTSKHKHPHSAAKEPSQPTNRSANQQTTHLERRQQLVALVAQERRKGRGMGDPPETFKLPQVDAPPAGSCKGYIKFKSSIC